MNKNEFYKQLMSEYSFDADKIRENAKRGKNARQKLQPMYSIFILYRYDYKISKRKCGNVK